MAELYDQDWSAALDGVDGFSTLSNTDGDMVWNSGTSPLNGSTGYVDVTVDDTTGNFGTFDFNSITTSKYRHHHYMDFGTLAIGSDNDSVRLFNWQNSGGTDRLCSITLIRLAGALNIRFTALTDAGGATDDDTVLSGTPEWFEMEATRATDATSNDGVFKLWIGGGDYAAGGVLISEITGIDNHTDFPLLEYFRLGATNISASVSGAFSFDRARGNDTGAEILVVTNTAPTITAQATKRMVYGVANATSFTVADAEDDALEVVVACTSGTLTAPLAAGAGVTVVSGSGTATLTMTGTVAQFTSMGSISYTQSGYTNDTITWNVDDGTVGGTQDTTTVTMETAKFYGGDLANLNAVLITLGLTADTVGSYSLRVTSVDSQDNTDVDTAMITVAEEAIGVGAGGTRIKYIKLKRRRRRSP